MTQDNASLPLVRTLPADFSLTRAFERLADLPGCLWLDSALRGPRRQPIGDRSNPDRSNSDRSNPDPQRVENRPFVEQPDAEQSIGRYSFLTADPVDRIIAFPSDPNPWPKLHHWCDTLPQDFDRSLPPFQGGIAGLIGYEAACWLEKTGLARIDDLPTPAMDVGLYDWVIAKDHFADRCFLISQGIGSSDRRQAAMQRADQVEAWMQNRLPPRSDRIVQRDLQRVDARVQHQFPTSIPGVTTNLSSQQYREQVNDIVKRIRAGDSFQVNVAQRLLHRATASSPELFLRLRKENPAPFAAYYHGDDFQVLSSSPEGFLRVRDRHVETRPIKGTVARTGDVQRDQQLATQLSASQKDRAENTMIVDLMRNDLSRACEDHSVKVNQLCEIERYQYVQHLVSVVEGDLRPDTNISSLLQFCFPGGSVTGAPKIEAMRTIAELEPHRRGPYCGSIGYIGCGDQADFNILIRTITAAGGYWQIPVGGGITARSDAATEEAETWAKAEGMLQAIKVQTG